MAGPESGATDIVVFRVGDEFLFSHYFDRPALFSALREHYVDDEYRFEVPADAFPAVRDRLREAGYEPTVVEDLAPYAVVTGRYEPHASILRDSVANWERRDHRFFLMKDDLAVERAITAGATPVEDTEFVLGI